MNVLPPARLITRSRSKDNKDFFCIKDNMAIVIPQSSVPTSHQRQDNLYSALKHPHRQDIDQIQSTQERTDANTLNDNLSVSNDDAVVPLPEFSRICRSDEVDRISDNFRCKELLGEGTYGKVGTRDNNSGTTNFFSLGAGLQINKEIDRANDSTEESPVGFSR